MDAQAEKLCPTCQTGRDTYILDNKNPFCPYLHFHDGTNCKMYKKLNIPKADTDEKSQCLFL